MNLDVLDADYDSYVRHHEIEQDCGNVSRWEPPMTFDHWLVEQPVVYLEVHDVNL